MGNRASKEDVDIPLVSRLRDQIVARSSVQTRSYKIPRGLMESSSKDKLGSVTVSYSEFNKNKLPVMFYPTVIMRFLPLVLDELPVLMEICCTWFVCLHDAVMLQYSKRILSGFVRTYRRHLLFTNATLSVQKLHTSDAGSKRVDLMIYAKVLPSLLGGLFSNSNVVELRYISEYYHDPKDKDGKDKDGKDKDRKDKDRKDDHGSPASNTSGSKVPNGKSVNDFRMHVLKKGQPRELWVRKDAPSFHGEDVSVCATPNTAPVCVEDVVEIPVTLANGRGVINPWTIRWRELRKVNDLTGLHCTLEKHNQLWFDFNTFVKRNCANPPTMNLFGDSLQLKSAVYAGCSLTIAKALYQPKLLGAIANTKEVLGSEWTVVPKDRNIVVPLQRRGLEHDRFTPFWLRQNDSLTMYLVVGGPEVQ